MKRIRYLGLGVAMALALIALPASASATGGFESEAVGDTTLLAEEVNGHHLAFAGLEIVCAESNLYNGVIKGRTATAVSTSPQWLNCPKSIETNGCQLILHPGSENNVEIGPPGCGPMKYVPNISYFCTVLIPSQSIPATYTNGISTGSKSVVDIEVDSKFTYVNKKEVPGSFCKDGQVGTGEYTGGWRLEGRDASGNVVDIYAVDQFSTGFYLAGKASEKEAEQPKFTAEQYPATIEGQQAEAHGFTPSYGYPTPIQCGTVDSDGELTATASVLSLEMGYPGCVYAKHSVTWTMNSCRYALNVLNSGPPYVGTVDVVCAKEGDAIEITLGSGCVIKTGPQKGLDSVSLTNFGSGAKRGVEVDFDLKGITSTFYGGFFRCLKAEKTTHTDGTYTGTTKLSGFVD